MKYYKEEILRKLSDTGWELVSIDSDHTDWWLDDLWEIQSVQQLYGLKLYIHFQVDPQYDGLNKSSAVMNVTVNQDRKLDYSASHGIDIAELYLKGGKFKNRIESFAISINKFRNGQNT